jgi:hypothetical protein
MLSLFCHLYTELISPWVRYTDNTLHSQAAVWVKAYCVTLSIDFKFKASSLQQGAPATGLAHIISGTL